LLKLEAQLSSAATPVVVKNSDREVAAVAAITPNANGGQQDEQILTVLYGLQEQMQTTREELQALRTAVAAAPNQVAARPEPSEEELARRAQKEQRRREKLMLDVPEEERAARMHEKWLIENQEELWAANEEMDRLQQLANDWIANNQ
jgi:beta-glucosidase/6-phospho-beta-glucosidase/beta-galactosidase